MAKANGGWSIRRAGPGGAHQESARRNEHRYARGMQDPFKTHQTGGRRARRLKRLPRCPRLEPAPGQRSKAATIPAARHTERQGRTATAMGRLPLQDDGPAPQRARLPHAPESSRSKPDAAASPGANRACACCRGQRTRRSRNNHQTSVPTAANACSLPDRDPLGPKRGISAGAPRPAQRVRHPGRAGATEQVVAGDVGGCVPGRAPAPWPAAWPWSTTVAWSRLEFVAQPAYRHQIARGTRIRFDLRA